MTLDPDMLLTRRDAAAALKAVGYPVALATLATRYARRRAAVPPVRATSSVPVGRSVRLGAISARAGGVQYVRDGCDMTAAEIAQALGSARRLGLWWRCVCPVHGSRIGRSLTLALRDHPARDCPALSRRMQP